MKAELIGRKGVSTSLGTSINPGSGADGLGVRGSLPRISKIAPEAMPSGRRESLKADQLDDFFAVPFISLSVKKVKGIAEPRCADRISLDTDVAFCAV